MDELLKVYVNNKNKSKLFDDYVTVDYYDGPTEALCKLKNSQKWFICSMVYFDPGKDFRILSVLELTDEWRNENRLLINELKEKNFENGKKIKGRINLYYKSYEGRVYLFKSDSLLSSKYEIVEMPISSLHYFKNMEAVMIQSKKSESKWLDYFKTDKPGV